MQQLGCQLGKSSVIRLMYVQAKNNERLTQIILFFTDMQGV